MSQFSSIHSWTQITGNFDLYGEPRQKTQPTKTVKLTQAADDELKAFANCQCLIHSRKTYANEAAPGITKDIQIPAKCASDSELVLSPPQQWSSNEHN